MCDTSNFCEVFPCVIILTFELHIRLIIAVSLWITSIYFREGLMSYKQFIQELEDDILPAEAERRF